MYRLATKRDMKGLQEALESRYIEEYLAGKGHSINTVKDLPKEEARRLMAEASRYASLKLAEVESKAHFRRTIHYPD